MTRRAFTLIELLVVIAIIALLVGILYPSLGSVKRLAKATACSSQMRNIGLAIQLYAQDNEDQLPRSSHSALAYGVLPWGYALCPYLGYGRYAGPGPGWDQLFNGLYRCPADDRVGEVWSYGKNVWFELQPAEVAELEVPSVSCSKLSNVPDASATIIFGELKSGSMGDHIMAHFWYMGGDPEVDSLRHGRFSEYVYLDNHTSGVPFATTFDPSKNIDRWNPATAH